MSKKEDNARETDEKSCSDNYRDPQSHDLTGRKLGEIITVYDPCKSRVNSQRGGHEAHNLSYLFGKGSTLFGRS